MAHQTDQVKLGRLTQSQRLLRQVDDTQTKRRLAELARDLGRFQRFQLPDEDDRD